jgi:30S ribosomal protein S31
MGKGDKKTKRGKIVIGSSGVKRARKKRQVIVKAPAKTEPKPVMELEETAVTSIKTAPKKSAKKAAEITEGTEEKPKAMKTKKKAADGDADHSITEPLPDEPAQN